MASRVSLRTKGKNNSKKGRGSEEKSTMESLKEWTDWSLQKGKVVVHYGFIPLIIYVGMNSEPKPQLFQLLSPF
ncbi:Mitochondrial import receptor subunit TOM7-1 [Linum grandiflorum]